MFQDMINELRTGIRLSQIYADNARDVAQSILSSDRDLYLRSFDIIARSRERMQAVSDSVFRIVPPTIADGQGADTL